jgi:hypothetical protein
MTWRSSAETATFATLPPHFARAEVVHLRPVCIGADTVASWARPRIPIAPSRVGRRRWPPGRYANWPPRDPKEGAALPEEEMSWLRWLPSQERRVCLDELLADLEAGADTDNLEPFARSVQAWQSTAEVWADPDLARRLRRSLPGNGKEISRPAIVTKRGDPISRRGAGGD